MGSRVSRAWLQPFDHEYSIRKQVNLALALKNPNLYDFDDILSRPWKKDSTRKTFGIMVCMYIYEPISHTSLHRMGKTRKSDKQLQSVVPTTTRSSWSVLTMSSPRSFLSSEMAASKSTFVGERGGGALFFEKASPSPRYRPKRYVCKCHGTQQEPASFEKIVITIEATEVAKESIVKVLHFAFCG
jgi:hypothetical protein